MGVCLCKDKVEDANNDQDPDIYTLIRQQDIDRNNSCNRSLTERVDELVKETLQIISSIVDDEPETPNSMLLLHDITDRPRGWLCLVRSLIRVIPIEHAMGPSVSNFKIESQNLIKNSYKISI